MINNIAFGPLAIIFSVIGFAAAIISTIATIKSVRLRYRAEKDLYTLMRQQSEEIQLSIQKLKKIDTQSREELVQEIEFKKLDKILDDLIKKLDQKEQEQINMGLKQNTLESKLDYVDKLLVQSGSTETEIFKSSTTTNSR